MREQGPLIEHGCKISLMHRASPAFSEKSRSKNRTCNMCLAHRAVPTPGPQGSSTMHAALKHIGHLA